MADDHTKIVQLHAATPEISADERARRLRTEVEQLACKPPAEWRFYVEVEKVGDKYGVAPTTLRQMIEATIRANDKNTQQAEKNTQQAEKKQAHEDKHARQENERERKERERIQKEEARKRAKRDEEYARIAKLPRISHDVKLIEAAKRLGEDIDTMRAEFAACYVPDPTDTSYIEPWEAPVDTRQLLEDLLAEIRRYIVINDLDAVAVALWILFAWLHDIAIHSPLLIVTAPEDDNAKSLLCKVISWLTPRAQFITQPTGRNIYRLVDHLRPTLIIDDADRLLENDRDLATVLNASWIRGTKIPRVVKGEIYFFDPFCPKCINLIGLRMPPQTLGRGIIIRLKAKLKEEKVERFVHRDNDIFIALRRKCLRWAADNAPALQHANPTDFDKRFGDNWHLLLATADLAGGNWPKQARAAAIRTARKQDQKLLSNRLLAAMRPILVKYKMIRSADLQKLLTADKDSEWVDYRGKGRSITQHEIAALLDVYEIDPDVIHPHRTESGRGYKLEWFEDAFRRYLPAASVQVYAPSKPKPKSKPRKKRRK
jgi:hypothetical protein